MSWILHDYTPPLLITPRLVRVHAPASAEGVVGRRAPQVPDVVRTGAPRAHGSRVLQGRFLEEHNLSPTLTPPDRTNVVTVRVMLSTEESWYPCICELPLHLCMCLTVHEHDTLRFTYAQWIGLRRRAAGSAGCALSRGPGSRSTPPAQRPRPLRESATRHGCQSRRRGCTPG